MTFGQRFLRAPTVGEQVCERAYKGATIRLIVAGANVRVVRDDGQLLRELTLDPSRDYQSRTPTPVHKVLRQVSSMS